MGAVDELRPVDTLGSPILARHRLPPPRRWVAVELESQQGYWWARWDDREEAWTVEGVGAREASAVARWYRGSRLDGLADNLLRAVRDGEIEARPNETTADLEFHRTAGGHLQVIETRVLGLLVATSRHDGECYATWRPAPLGGPVALRLTARGEAYLEERLS
jgi:hypothetical protein